MAIKNVNHLMKFSITQGVALLSNGTLHGNINFYGATTSQPGPSRVSFHKTKKMKPTPKFEHIAVDKQLISTLLPHQKKAFWRKFYKAGRQYHTHQC